MDKIAFESKDATYPTSVYWFGFTSRLIVYVLCFKWSAEFTDTHHLSGLICVAMITLWLGFFLYNNRVRYILVTFWATAGILALLAFATYFMWLDKLSTATLMVTGFSF